MQTPPPGDAPQGRPDAWQAPSGPAPWGPPPTAPGGGGQPAPGAWPGASPSGHPIDPAWPAPSGATPGGWPAPSGATPGRWPAPAPIACYRHPQVAAGVRCQRCGRPICGACMVEAPVGFQCPECVAAAAAQTRQVSVARGGSLRRNTSGTTVALIAVNALVWVGILLTGGARGPLFNWLALTPTGVCDTGGAYYTGIDAIRCIASGGSWLPGVADGAYWQLLTAGFAHESALHIGFNMLALWFLGPQVERVIGRSRFLALYLLSLLTASVAVYWLAAPTTTTLGASGAVFGLMGALLILAMRLGGDVRQILVWLGLNLAITVFGSATISWQGHLGGLVGGLIVTAILIRIPPERARARQTALAVMTGVLVLLVVLRTFVLV